MTQLPIPHGRFAYKPGADIPDAWNEASAQANRLNALDYLQSAIECVEDNNKTSFPLDNVTLACYARARFERGVSEMIELFHRRPFAFNLNKTPRCL